MSASSKCPHCGYAVAMEARTCTQCGKGLTGRDLLAKPVRSGGMVLMLVLAIVAGGVGLLALSNATLGVGLLACACLLAIAARIVQAEAQHQEVLRELARRQSSV